MDQTDETTAPGINKQRTVKYGISLDTKQMIKVKELTLLQPYASADINHVLPNLFKHLSLAHPDLFRELGDPQVSASFINSDLI